MMPTTVRIGYRDYRIEPWTPIEASSAESYGECSSMRGVIRIREDLGAQHKAEVVLHEVIHAMCEMGEINSSDEEKIVSVLAKQLAQVWRDNPALVEFINRSLLPNLS